MKKAILALALVMSIGATQVSLASSAPKHRYHPTTHQVDPKAAPASAAQPSASKDKDDEALEAYSDTTSTDSANYDDYDENDNRSVHSRYSLDNYDDGCYDHLLYHLRSAVCLCSADHRFSGYQISDSPPQRPDETGGDGDGEGHQCSGKRPSDRQAER